MSKIAASRIINEMLIEKCIIAAYTIYLIQ